MKEIHVWNPSYMMIMKFKKRDYEINKTDCILMFGNYTNVLQYADPY